MLAAPAAFKRRDSDRPSIGGTNSHARDITSSNGSTAPPPQGATNTPNNPTAIHTHINELSAKRIATLAYLQHLYTPTNTQTYHFNTLSYTQAHLSALPSLHLTRQSRRATSYLLLGYSLPALLDLNSSNPLEYLRALTALLTEFETYQSLLETSSTAAYNSSSSLSRAKMGAMFKTSMGLGSRVGTRGRRASATPDGIASMHQQQQQQQQNGTSDAVPASSTTAVDAASADAEAAAPVNLENCNFTHLLTPHLPFDPDFTTTFMTLCEALMETYSNLLQLINGAEGEVAASTCSPAVGEAFNKADKLVRKLLVANVLKEFEEHTRIGVRSEVGGVGKLVLGGLM